jgi:hypothetical protein
MWEKIYFHFLQQFLFGAFCETIKFRFHDIHIPSHRHQSVVCICTRVQKRWLERGEYQELSELATGGMNELGRLIGIDDSSNLAFYNCSDILGTLQKADCRSIGRG